jgi:hypothetical protein
MKKIILLLVVFSICISGYGQRRIPQKKAIIYNIMEEPEHYIDSLITSDKLGKKPYAVIRPRRFRGVDESLTYEIYIDFYPYKNSLLSMIPIIEKTNRFLKIGNKLVPVVFEELDQVFALEGAKKEKMIGFERFPQPNLILERIIVVDMGQKRWKIEDLKDW